MEADSYHQHLYRFPQSKSVDIVRWVPPVSAFDRFLIAATNDSFTSTSSLDIQSLTLGSDSSSPSTPSLHLRSTWASPSRITSLSSPRYPSSTLLPFALSTLAGSLHFLFLDPVEGSVESEGSVTAKNGDFHNGPISAVDLQVGGRDCVSVGEDGKVNVVTVGDGGKLGWRRVGDSTGLVSYTAVKWGSPMEFATGGLGFGVQLWDQRKAGGLVSQLKGNWSQGRRTGIVHSVDIHPSRKHICIVGGSSGTVFAWDLRRQEQPIMLSGTGPNDNFHSPCESEVWEVQCDSDIQFQSDIDVAAPSSILPIMTCSEDGILAVHRQGEDALELLAENCAINSFDIDQQNPSDVAIGLEWESIAILTRSRVSTAMY